MTDYLTEQEQIELLKNWIKQYSLVIIAGILMAIVFVSGWRVWQYREAKQKIHASRIFDEMLTQRAQNNKTMLAAQANRLQTHYKRTIYAQFGALLMARNYVNEQKYQDATSELNWVLDRSRIPVFRQIARIRLARVQLAENLPAKAIKTLATVEDTSFQPLIDETLGDAYLAQNERSKARDFYSKALTALPNAEMLRPILQIKYDNLIS